MSNHPPVFSTPAPPTSARQWSTQRVKQRNPLNDAIDSSPISSGAEGDEDEENQDRHLSLNDSIDTDSPSASRSSLGYDARPIKRRRISISPEIDASSNEDEDDGDRMQVDDDEQTEDGLRVRPAVEEGEEEEDVMAIQSGSSSEDTESECSKPGSPTPAEPHMRNPTFHKAPRFKATELAEGGPKSILPDVFSPQRRGARYVPGGLAAELREWLVQVKGASEYDRPTRSKIEAIADEAKNGNGMWLVAAHEQDDTGQQSEGDLAKIILAGDGRITGLNGRNEIQQGTAVSLHQPMWDINLNDLGQFAVACDWEIPED